MSKSPVFFALSKYRLAHGHDPRGRGGWAFDFGGGPEFAPGSLLYSQARRWAVSRAHDLDVRRVEVCS